MLLSLLPDHIVPSVVSHVLFVCKPLDKSKSINIPVPSGGVMEFVLHSLPMELHSADCTLSVHHGFGLHWPPMTEIQEPEKFIELEYPKTDCGVGLCELREILWQLYSTNYGFFSYLEKVFFT